MIFTEIPLHLTAAQLGHRSAILCLSHICRDNPSLIQHTEISHKSRSTYSSQSSMSPRSWILISADEVAMQLTRRHSGKSEERWDMNTPSSTQCTLLKQVLKPQDCNKSVTWCVGQYKSWPFLCVAREKCETREGFMTANNLPITSAASKWAGD